MCVCARACVRACVGVCLFGHYNASLFFFFLTCIIIFIDSSMSVFGCFYSFDMTKSPNALAAV